MMFELRMDSNHIRMLNATQMDVVLQTIDYFHICMLHLQDSFIF